MRRIWPRTDVLRDLQVAADGSCATARTDLYLQGGRHHIHTTTILIAIDGLVSTLLEPGEGLPDIGELQFRHLSNRNLTLSVATAAEHLSPVSAPAIRGTLSTNRGRTLFVEGAVGDQRVHARTPAPGIFGEVMERMRLDVADGDVHRTTLDALPRSRANCRDPIATRYAIVEFVLEATRQRILERFGDIAGAVLVVAGWKDVAWPRWADVVHGCELAYRLDGDALSNGVRLVHCDFAFPRPPRGGRLTIARIPAARMDALRR
jgi:hypothetical protein